MLSGSRFFVHVGDREYPLGPGDTQIGRHPACDIVAPDTTVSRRHARLRLEGEQVVVEDLGSRNGVRINHEPIGGAHPVRHGDRISLGDFELILRDSTKPPPRDAKPTEPHARRAQKTPIETPRADEPTQPTVYEPLLASLERSVDEGTEEGIERAEQALRRWVRDERKTSAPPDERVLHRLGELALRVAHDSGRLVLIDGLFAVCAYTEHVPAEDLVDALEQLPGRDALSRSSSLWAYVSRLGAGREHLDDEARARLARLRRLAGMGGGSC